VVSSLLPQPTRSSPAATTGTVKRKAITGWSSLTVRAATALPGHGVREPVRAVG
jgi:hypothetical protein